ncbi:short chain dehydrogenase [Acetobacter aceti NRIC 0242]|uniref:Short chain dehydrogenase n=1 Tax=Acetobacter aceti NBRC 14818 TaxID=887700 RepID=A0AB33IAN2_ACEAC|nr:SDR family oxidoreductase [Acetobacter aceti]TCS35411.1 NAD(P)-dependent dehydrogenase (short-subunit alcohol dehydrogenase family) [Acetobacter aceti NBRC 14818]BCK75202.1 short chain dehydrogenase [Acetobacter aceti NBRC 14818]GAN57508.1 oxidoreductase/short-chain dehydrogenase/reductase SDR [Acetobacter aceti NBRC 14818]GBO79500.1 short chain dehydrogenase [Acetobacter aceti NRIC 0242]
MTAEASLAGTLIAPDIPRIAFITGGAQRLGRAMALALAGAGFSVAVHYRSGEDDAHSLKREIEAMGRQCCLLRADLAEEKEVTGLIAKAVAALGGPIGVLVNNASTFDRDEWNTVTRESWDAHMEPNLRAPYVLTQEFAKQLPADREGMVLNMLDERVWSLTPHFVSYTVSKSALWTLTQTMALALAPKKIRVNAIGPGPALPSTRQTQEQFQAQCASVPLGRGTSPEEVSRALLAFLVLPSVTGQMLALDGAQHLQWYYSPLVSTHVMEE